MPAPVVEMMEWPVSFPLAHPAIEEARHQLKEEASLPISCGCVYSFTSEWMIYLPTHTFTS
jgi:hypothetical protein